MNATDLGAAISNSLSLSSILILTALGLAITFGVMRVINMAHGDLLMIGAYTAFFFTNKRALPIVVRNIGNWFGERWEIDFGFELGLYLAIPLSFVVVAFVGYLMEVLLIRHLYGRPLDTLLATWGVGMVLQQAARSIFGAANVDVIAPAWLNGGVALSPGVLLSYKRILTLALAVLCIAAIHVYVTRSAPG